VERIVIGTRGSELALRQAEIVRGVLSRAEPARTVTIRIVKAVADRDLGTPLWGFGGPGVFVRELEHALLAGKITVAVHSLKDLPCDLPEGLCLAACPEREDPRDVLVSREGLALARLPEGARVGTGSPRRQAQLRHVRPDLRFVEVRGNLNTRLRKLDTLGLDALVLAAAGLHRSGQREAITEYLRVEDCVPTAGQGALALEAREDEPLLPLLRGLTDLGAGCTTPLGVYAEVEGDRLVMRAALASPDGARLLRETITGPIGEPETTGSALAAALRARGADELIRAGQFGGHHT
jgi:hydroxymethylbilane synthase